MSKLMLVGLSLISSFIFTAANAATPDLSGTYVGCGQSSAFGNRPIVFHLTKLPTGLEPDQFQYSGAFTLQVGSAIYFPEVQFSADGSRLFMRTEIRPTREFGMIINTLIIDVLPDGSLSGVYKTNSMTATGALLGAVWTAVKVKGDVLPRMNCPNP